MIDRVAYVSMHTSPLLPPGEGDAGGMNVYIDELATTMAARGVTVTVFTRRADPGTPEVIDVSERYRVVHIDAGPPEPMPIRDMPAHVAAFTDGTLAWIDANNVRPAVIHTHYWLSGWSGVILKEALKVPLANSFHTLGRVRDQNRRHDEPPSSPMRTMTEEEVIANSDCVIASTPHEFDDLLEHYGAQPERLCTSPPGVDHRTFRPGVKSEARRALGLPPDAPIVLFVGRIQPLKAADVAIDAVAALDGYHGLPAPHLLVIGGPSGPDGLAETTRLHTQVADLGIVDRVHFLPPQPHTTLHRYYQASDVVVVPSRSESFGLVAAEAQACGVPVVAAAVGGLPFVVDHDVSGLLVDGHDPAEYAKAISAILWDRPRAARMSVAAVRFSQQFSWTATADRFLELYAGISDA